MKDQFWAKLVSALSIGLFAGALLAVLLAGERIFAAILDAWKFADAGHWHGIDLGARSSVQFVFLCLVGTAGCYGMRIRADSNNTRSKILHLAIILYAIAGSVIPVMVSIGAAYLYCGR